MKILHSSDWHLGRSLFAMKRYEEFEAFLDWLATTIEQQQIDCLLVAGDVFDNSVPSHRAQGLYYRFLGRVANSCCRHIVIIAGNHDSPSFLNAPKELLLALNVNVIGQASERLENEVLVLKDPLNQAELIVCAVPYLRDRDIRQAVVGESVAEKEQNLVNGISTHYANVASVAESKRQALGLEIPIVAMGHLFTTGGQTLDGDGVRDLYVGSLAHVTSSIFPSNFDYVALGHLHIPQMVAGRDTVRYSGSPIAMGFGEAKQQKSVCVIEFTARQPQLTLLPIPVFQALERIKGDWDSIHNRLCELSRANSSTWLEIIYEGNELISDLRERLEISIENSSLQILRIKNNRIMNQMVGQMQHHETLEDLTINDVFERCLESHEINPEQAGALRETFAQTLQAMQELDTQAE